MSSNKFVILRFFLAIYEEKLSFDAFLTFLFISVEHCKYMDSKMRPLYLVFENADELGDLVRIIFKNGDGKSIRRVNIIIYMLGFCTANSNNNNNNNNNDDDDDDDKLLVCIANFHPNASS